MIHGRDLILSINGTTLAASTTCDLSTTTDFIEVCAPTGGEWKDYIPTQHGWDVSAGCLVATMENYNNLLLMQKQKQRLELSFCDKGLQVFYKGDVYIKKLDLTGTYGNLAKMSVAFQACGELKTATVQAIDMTTATEVADRSIQWIGGLSGDAFSIMSMSDVNIMIHELTLTTDTRITIGKGIVVNADAATVTTYIGNRNAQSISATAILINSTTAEKSVVVKTQSAIAVTVICNEDDLTTLKYLSKF